MRITARGSMPDDVAGAVEAQRHVDRRRAVVDVQRRPAASSSLRRRPRCASTGVERVRVRERVRRARAHPREELVARAHDAGSAAGTPGTTCSCPRVLRVLLQVALERLRDGRVRELVRRRAVHRDRREVVDARDREALRADREARGPASRTSPSRRCAAATAPRARTRRAWTHEHACSSGLRRLVADDVPSASITISSKSISESAAWLAVPGAWPPKASAFGARFDARGHRLERRPVELLVVGQLEELGGGEVLVRRAAGR